jgi:hypothetical protein
MKETVAAINDLIRVVIALSGKFGSKSDAIRKLNDLGIPPTRIAAILTMEPKDVTSVISKAKKTKPNGK